MPEEESSSSKQRPLKKYQKEEFSDLRFCDGVNVVSVVYSRLTIGPLFVIFRCEDAMASIFDHEDSKFLLGKKFQEIFPTMDMKSTKLQFVCAIMENGKAIPCAVTLVPSYHDEEVEYYDVYVYSCTNAQVYLHLDNNLQPTEKFELLDEAVGFETPKCLFDIFAFVYILHDKRNVQVQCVWNHLKRTGSFVGAPGEYLGHMLHKDGSYISTTFTLEKLRDGYLLFLSHNIEFQIALPLHSCQPRMDNDDYVSGIYGDRYSVGAKIGEGAFGTVMISKRKGQDEESVTKFITKHLVLYEGWYSSTIRGGKMIPIEIHILEHLDHPNIIQVLDAYENSRYFCMVMERRPNAVDLYEFLDWKPLLHDNMIAHIFRQIASAVSYLHSMGIVHRDIKDENIVIDSNFHCQLIDFGSAAFFGDNVYFSAYCGTVQYAGPEYFKGEKYRGPEMEMWLMGILLYTMIFFDSPYHTAEEKRVFPVRLPHKINDGPDQLLGLLLCPKEVRCTVADILQHWWIDRKLDIAHYKWEDVIARRPFVPAGYETDYETQQQDDLLQNAMKDLDIGSKIMG